MSFYKGKIRNVPGIEGKLTGQPQELSAVIQKVDTAPSVTITRVAGITARLHRLGVAFASGVRALNILYRFIAAKAAIFVRHKADGSTAPVVDLAIDESITTTPAAPIKAQPVQAVNVHSKPVAAVLAQLVAYERAAIRYIKKIYMGCLAGLCAALGAVATYAEALQIKSVYKAVAALGAIMESRFNVAITGHTATGETATAAAAESTDTLPAELTAQAAQAPAAQVETQSIATMTRTAKIVTWIYPEIVDGELILRQAYGATQSGNKLEVE